MTSDNGLLDYRHPTAGFSLPVPPTWELLEDPQPSTALVAVEPENELGFRANLVVTLETLPRELDLDSWQASGQTILARTLNDFLLLDSEHTEIAGHDAVRRLAHHAVPKRGAVTMEQWSMLVDGTGYTLTTSVSTLAYDSLSDLFAEIARQFRPPDEPPGSGGATANGGGA